MSSTGYLIWFLAQTVMTVVVIGGGVALGTGVFDKGEREKRRARHEAERVARARVDIPAQRSVSGQTVARKDHTAPS